MFVNLIHGQTRNDERGGTAFLRDEEASHTLLWQLCKPEGEKLPIHQFYSRADRVLKDLSRRGLSLSIFVLIVHFILDFISAHRRLSLSKQSFQSIFKATVFFSPLRLKLYPPSQNPELQKDKRERKVLSPERKTY